MVLAHRASRPEIAVEEEYKLATTAEGKEENKEFLRTQSASLPDWRLEVPFVPIPRHTTQTRHWIGLGIERESQMRKEEMELKFQYDMQLAQLDVGFKREKEKMIEDRKDQRTRISGTQQSEMISQRKNDTPPTNFTETENPDGINLSAFNMQ